MSNLENNFEQYYNEIYKRIDEIIEWRCKPVNEQSESESKSRFFETRFKNVFSTHFIENQYLQNFFDLVWNNYQDKAKTKNQMKTYLKELITNFKEATKLKKGVIAYQLLTKTARGSFCFFMRFIQ